MFLTVLVPKSYLLIILLSANLGGVECNEWLLLGSSKGPQVTAWDFLVICEVKILDFFLKFFEFLCFYVQIQNSNT